jgi:FAD/FMN-containing dehydrogenase
MHQRTDCHASVPHCVKAIHASKRSNIESAVLNDVHARLNRTEVAQVIPVASVGDIVDAIRYANRENHWISVSGGRHAMGGQQFAAAAIHLDMRSLNRVLAFDEQRGTITVEAGIEWPKLIREYRNRQQASAPSWGIVQKQTGADRLSIGGAVAANIHGRCLTAKPFVQDVESFVLIDASGQPVRCSREENRELFRLAVGGYGLFGIVASVTLRLARRCKVQRVVDCLTVDQLMPAFAKRIEGGYLYGDFQFAIDPNDPAFLYDGIFSCYRPVPDSTPIPPHQLRLSKDDWNELLYLAHVDKTRAFERFRNFYWSTNNQVYWSDTHQSGYYLDDYHQALDKRMGAPHRATEVITELYVPRRGLAHFLADVRQELRAGDADLIYGTIRLIERDDESFLNWAREDFACVVLNLHTEHTPAGLAKSRRQFERLIDVAIRHRGSYFLTYHRYASASQILACYPQFPAFLDDKKRYDPQLRFQSEWYRHYELLLASVPHV